MAVTFVGTLMIVRTIKRSRYFSQTITSHLRCPCGKIQGTITALPQDTVRLHCYCRDCHDYAIFIKNFNKSSNDAATTTATTSSGSNSGDGNGGKPPPSRRSPIPLVQVCKSDITINQGLEYMKLSRKYPPNKGMFRYYSSCCNMPLMNTWDVLGFVGVIEENLDSNKEKFVGPFRCYDDDIKNSENEKETTSQQQVPGLPVVRLVWNLIRYLPWRNHGPFDYTAEPTVFWGENSDKQKNE